MWLESVCLVSPIQQALTKKYWRHMSLKVRKARELPGSPAVRTLHFHSWGPDLNPIWGIKIPESCAIKPKKKKKTTHTHTHKMWKRLESKSWLPTWVACIQSTSFLVNTLYQSPYTSWAFRKSQRIILQEA